MICGSVDCYRVHDSVNMRIYNIWLREYRDVGYVTLCIWGYRICDCGHGDIGCATVDTGI